MGGDIGDPPKGDEGNWFSSIDWDDLVAESDDLFTVLAMADAQLPIGDVAGLVAMGGARLGKLMFGASNVVKVGTTVLGHYPQYVKVAETIGARSFQLPAKFWNKMTPAMQWIANQKFLDRMILRGDNIRLATPLNQVKPGSFYQKELNYLFERGYKVSSDGLWLVK